MNRATVIAGTLTAAALAAGATVPAVMAAAPASTMEGTATDAAAVKTIADAHDAQGLVMVANVRGEFTATQDELTPTQRIASVFRKATSALCSSLPDYDVTAQQGGISVKGDISKPFSATVSEMAEEEGSTSYTLKCACASNIPGGGAIANARVEGVSLASIAAMAGA